MKETTGSILSRKHSLVLTTSQVIVVMVVEGKQWSQLSGTDCTCMGHCVSAFLFSTST